MFFSHQINVIDLDDVRISIDKIKDVSNNKKKSVCNKNYVFFASN